MEVGTNISFIINEVGTHEHCLFFLKYTALKTSILNILH